MTIMLVYVIFQELPLSPSCSDGQDHYTDSHLIFGGRNISYG